MFFFNFLKSQTLSDMICNVFLQTLPPVQLRRSWYIFVDLRLTEHLEQCASLSNICLKPLTSGTQTRLPSCNTPWLFRMKSFFLLRTMSSLILHNRMSWYWFCFISSINDLFSWTHTLINWHAYNASELVV